MEQIEERGIDSYMGRIALDERDTLVFDLGRYSNTLTEEEPLLIQRLALKDFPMPIDTAELIVVENVRGVDKDRYRKQNVLWDTIDGYTAKIVLPRQSIIGLTGVYIDSLWTRTRGADRDRFNLYGIDLKSHNREKLLQAIQTLRFEKGRQLLLQ